MVVERYTEAWHQRWNQFVQASINGTFLFDRGFMEYHSDRFEDHSLLFHDSKGVRAILPAHVRDAILHSHSGLSYGGLVWNHRTKSTHMADIVLALKDYMRQQDLQRCVYSPVPFFYHRRPSGEDLYVLRRGGFQWHSQVCNFVVDLTQARTYNQNRRRVLAKPTAIEVRKSSDFETYMDLLQKRLADKYDGRPVHATSEILQLQNNFPDHIHLIAAFAEMRMVGGILIFESQSAIKAQYIASNMDGDAQHAVSHLIHQIIEEYGGRKRYFDLGSANLEDGSLNASLAQFKESFGARAWPVNTYVIFPE